MKKICCSNEGSLRPLISIESIVHNYGDMEPSEV